MPDYRHVWQFRQTGGESWSEVWYRTATDIGAAATVSATIINARLKLLDNQNTFLKIRVSETTNSRVTGLKTVNLKGTIGEEIGCMPAGCAVVCGLGGSAGGTRRWWLRGISNNAYKRNAITGEDEPAPGFLENLESFFKAMKTGAFGIRQLTKVGVGGVLYRKITKADGTTANGLTKLTIEAGAVLNPPARVVISQVSAKDLPALNGHYQVIAADATSVTVNYTTPQNAMINTPTGRLKLESYSAVSVLDPALCAFDHLGTRTSKSPNAGTRGARRAKRLRNLA